MSTAAARTLCMGSDSAFPCILLTDTDHTSQKSHFTPCTNFQYEEPVVEELDETRAESLVKHGLAYQYPT